STEITASRLSRIAAAQILADRLGLSRGLHNDECAALCRSGVGNLGIRRGWTRVRALLARRPFLLGLHFFWFHCFFFISHSSTLGQRLDVETSRRLGVRIFTIQHRSAQAGRPLQRLGQRFSPRFPPWRALLRSTAPAL